MKNKLDDDFDQCFAGEFDRRTKVLVLGSLPGQASLAAHQYYAHPQNKFWAIMSQLFKLEADDYQSRLRQLNASNVGLWDVYAQAIRKGSLDADIRQQSAVLNDFSGIKKHCPDLAVIACNGKKAFDVFRKKIWPKFASSAEFKHISILSLPSTSPAYAAMSFEEKLKRWSVIKSYITMNIEAEIESAKPLLAEIELVYKQLSEGLDVSPRCVYGIEAKANLLIEQKHISLQVLMDFCQQQIAQQQLFVPEGYWQWVVDRQTFCLPAFMQEAPVKR